MKTSIATVSISGGLEEKLDAIAAAGFDGVEIFENDFLAFDGGPEVVGEMVRDRGLEITLFQPFRDFEGLPEPLRSGAFERAERKFDLMERLGAELMLICSSVAPEGIGGIDRAAADLGELGERAAKRGLRVGYEALAWGRYVNDHRDAWEIVRRAGHSHVGLILDSFHTLARRIDPESIRSIPGDKIFIVQLADAPSFDMEMLQWSRHYRSMPGQGDLPVGDFMHAVLATGYAGVLSLEIFNDQFRGSSPRSIAVDGHRSLVNLMDQVNRNQPEIAIEVPVIPPPVPVRAVSFVEFAAGEDDAGPFADLLTAMGFARTGQHRSKRVARYQQGEINFVINTETEGLARSAYLAHGLCAYAFGLVVEDAGDAVARATALGAAPFSQPTGPAELAIPAVRGVGGGVIYFIDSKGPLSGVWETEFKTVEPEAGRDAGLQQVDHIAQTMDYREMLTWLLFYGSIFATRKLPMVDVLDPGGLVRSQVIENSEGTLRITLNGVESRRTLAGRFLEESFGSTVQHIAFSSRDIFSTADKLAANGMAGLKISPNYYDDLDARFRLDPALLDRLRGASILYDRDGEAEYFQLYSQAFGDGLFFEIVERRAGYAGYGAANAPIRIAAQRRGLSSVGRL